MAMVLVRDCGPEKEMTRAILMTVGWDCGTCDRDSTLGCQGIQTEGSSSCSYGPVHSSEMCEAMRLLEQQGSWMLSVSIPTGDGLDEGGLHGERQEVPFVF